ncbi:MAG: tetratricopeptide repeat protein [Bacteroidales bacterium]
MKKFAALILILTMVLGLNAQNSKRTSAFNYLRYGKLDKAKEAIDAATEHPKTKDEAKTWFYRGNVYLAIQLTEEEEFKNLAENPLNEAYQAYKKAQELDDKGELTQEISDRILVCAEQYYNSGVAAYNEKDYDESVDNFMKAAKINEDLGATDTLSYFYAAQSAYFADNFDQSKELFGKLMDIGFEDVSVYRILADVHKSQGDTAQALEVIKDGRKDYPDDYNLMIDEVNIYIATDRKEEAVELLELAIQKETNDPLIFFNAGVIYSDLDRLDKAVKAYDKAIELQPDYFDPYYNMGALYVNQASEILAAADTLNPMDRKEAQMYEEMKKEADEVLEKSLPYIEKADELQPGDPGTLRTLRDIYVRLNMMDKVKEVNEKLNELKE